MASPTKYYGRDGRACHHNEWARLRNDPSYRVVRQFDNGSVHVELEWLGDVPDADNQFRGSYRLFKIKLSNYNDVGVAVEDPMSGKFFPNESKALTFYDDFILKWTESVMDEDGNVEEVGNTLAPIEPPKPPDPNKPLSTVDSIDVGNADMSAGAW